MTHPNWHTGSPLADQPGDKSAARLSEQPPAHLSVTIIARGLTRRDIEISWSSDGSWSRAQKDTALRSALDALSVEYGRIIDSE